MTSYLDFDIEIGQGTGREYPVVVRSPAGEARAKMLFPFDELALENQLLTLQNVLLRSGGRRRLALSQDELTVQEFGKALFASMLVDDARSLFYECRRLADQRGAGVRVRLRLASPTLAALPWEFLYDPWQGHVCLSVNTPIVRYLELPQPPQALMIAPPLRVLGMIVSPSDLPDLDLERERTRLERAIAPLRNVGLVELVWLEGQTWRDLLRALRRGPWHVFHFAGHGAFDPSTDEGLVMLANEEGRSRTLRATELGRLLADHKPLRLVVLNACEGGRGSQRDIFSSTASILVKAGLPAVVAMQYEITDQAAIELTRAFYEALADELPVDAALAEARKAVSLAVANSFEWGTPVLYMRAPDGVLFELAEAPARPVPPPEPVRPPAPPSPQPSLSLSLSTPDGSVRIGDEATWTVVVMNDGEDDLRHVSVYRGRTLLEDPFDLPAGEERRLAFQARYDTEGEKAEKVTATAFAADGTIVRQEAGATVKVEPTTAPPPKPATVRKVETLPDVLKITEPIQLELVLVPAGEFLMGSDKAKDRQARDDEQPQHLVRLDEFYIGRYPVTNAQYAVFVQATEHKPPTYWKDGKIPSGKELHPAVYVSWHDAVAFCRWLNKTTGHEFRLPTEAEWEKAASWDAAREQKRIYPWGDKFDPSKCNTSKSEKGGTTEVGAYSPAGDSPYGVADMAGNAWDWVADWYDSDYYQSSPADNPQGPQTGDRRVLRGGAFNFHPENARCANRYRHFDPAHRFGHNGFRVCSSLR